jgi:hypothetical protein
MLKIMAFAILHSILIYDSFEFGRPVENYVLRSVCLCVMSLTFLKC